MFNAFVRWVCSFWEVPDNLPGRECDGVVGMAIPQMADGKPSKHMAAVVSEVVKITSDYKTGWAIFSNRWPIPQRGISLCELEAELAVKLGLKSTKIRIPSCPRDGSIRNTWTEVEYAISVCIGWSENPPPKIFIISNHLHTRRVIATFQKQLRGRVSGWDCELYWRSVGSPEDYGRGYSQKRFIHPSVFLCYEVFAMLYSKLVGWV